jgi:protein ImuB
MAFASIFVPNFILQAVVRAEPELRERALALIDGNPPLCNVVVIDEKASRAGIQLGMTKANAEQFAGVEIRTRSRAQEKTAHAALLDIGWSISPRIEDTAEDAIALDVAGLSYLFESEEEIGAELVRRSSECGLTVRVAIAANVETALVAARGFPGVTVIPAGQEAKYLSELLTEVLSPSEEIVETLGRWGVRTCGAFAELPVLQLSERLGQEGVRLHALARGASSRSLSIVEAGPSFEEEMELEDAVEELDPLSFLLGRLLDQLCARLTARSLAAGAIRVRFELQPSCENAMDPRNSAFFEKNAPGLYEKELPLPIPTRDSKMLLKLLRLRLQFHPPAAPVQKIMLTAEVARPRATQSGLFLPSFPDPEKLGITIVRIAKVVGEGNVGAPSLVDTHRPGTFQVERFAAPLEIARTNRHSRDAGHRDRQHELSKIPMSFRSFRPAIPAKLETREGVPVRVVLQGVCGEVLAASGPWHTSGDWWQEDFWNQEEWDLQIRFPLIERHNAAFANSHPADGLYLLFYDTPRQRWFVRGIYD